MSVKHLAVFIIFICCTICEAETPDAATLQEWNSHMIFAQELSDEELLDLASTAFDCYLVPHTHWDKEWAFSFEQHHIRLVKLVDNAIDILERVPEYRCFVLDGQSSLIADYLHTRPEMSERVKALASQGRLLLGPWYTQGDMLISSGEEMIRNLLYGMRAANEAGGVMMFGYTADNFGYNQHTPQLYSGFGINGASMYRGPDRSADYSKNVFTWRAPDGSSVDVVNLLGPSAYLLFTWPFDVPTLPEAMLLRALPYKKPHALTKKIVLPAGSDGLEPGADLPKVIEQLKKNFPAMNFRIASYQEFLNDVREEQPAIPSYSGMLRKDHACTGCISSRLDLKRQNGKAYTTLEYFAEPFSAFAWMIMGRRYPATSLEESWKYLMENLSHDSMAGYSIDPVHTMNQSRFYEANRLAETLAIRAMKTLVEGVDAPHKDDVSQKPIVVFNPLGWARSDVVETWYSVTARGRRSDPFKEGGYQSFSVVNKDGEKAAAAIVREGGDRFRITFLAEDVPACGYKTYFLRAENETEELTQPAPTTKIENTKLRLTFLPDGRFDLFDKEQKKLYPGLGYFENMQMPGASPLGCRISDDISSSIGQKAEITLVEDNSVYKTVCVTIKDWRIPVTPGSDEATPLPITMNVSLSGESKRVDIYTEIDNRSINHMVRAVFPTPAIVDSFALGTQFGAQNAPVYDKNNPPDGPWEHEIYPCIDWCDVSDGEHGLAVLSRETPVTSVYSDEDGAKGAVLKLPLFRSTRSNNEDIRPSIPYNRLSTMQRTISTQLLGVQRIHFSLFTHAGDWQDAVVYKEAENAAVRLWPETLTINDYSKWQIGPYGFPATAPYPRGDMPLQMSYIDVKTEGIVISAVKKAENGDDLIVRLYNVLPKEVNAEIDFFQLAESVKAVGLAESESDEHVALKWQVTPEQKTHIQTTFKSNQIVTLRLATNVATEKRWHQTLY